MSAMAHSDATLLSRWYRLAPLLRSRLYAVGILWLTSRRVLPAALTVWRRVLGVISITRYFGDADCDDDEG